MLALDLNLASRPFKNNTLLWTGYVSGLVLVVACSVWNVISWRNHVNELEELQQTVGSIEGQMENLNRREEAAREGIAGFDVEALGIQAFKANEVIEWRVFSWTRLFNLMEQIQPYDVRMSSIRPLFRAGRRAEELGTDGVTAKKAVPVSVEGVAKNHGSFLELQRSLLANGQIGRVFPERMNVTDTGEVVFDLTFVYLPDNEADPPEEAVAEAEAAPIEESGEAELPAQEAAGEAEAAADDGAGVEAPAGAAVPVVVRPGTAGPENPAPQEKADAVKTELTEEPSPRRRQPRAFVKGRGKAKRGEQP